MTEMTKRLNQKGERELCRSAFAHTRDVNEAYMLVHCVMTRAFGRAVDADVDLAPSMTCALNARARHLQAAA
jgi:hypothetical protein